MPRGDGGFGALLGVGAIVGVGILLSRRASAADRGSPRERPSFPTRAVGPLPLLVERWRPAVEQLAADLPVPAILEWIRLESGGDMCSTGGPTEVGIFQLFFPADAKYGATLAGLRSLCAQSQHHNPADLSWLTDADLDMEVGAGIRKIQDARATVRRVFAASGVRWPEGSFDFGSAVKQIHAAPAVITELVPKIARRDGAPTSWADLRQSVLAFPVEQMGSGLAALATTPSKHGYKNRLEDTLRNAESVGRAWGPAAPGSSLVA